MVTDHGQPATARVQVAPDTVEVERLGATLMRLIERLNAASARLEHAVAAYRELGRLQRPGTVQIYADGTLLDALSTTDLDEALARMRRHVGGIVQRVNVETDQADALAANRERASRKLAPEADNG